MYVILSFSISVCMQEVKINLEFYSTRLRPKQFLCASCVEPVYVYIHFFLSVEASTISFQETTWIVRFNTYLVLVLKTKSANVVWTTTRPVALSQLHMTSKFNVMVLHVLSFYMITKAHNTPGTGLICDNVRTVIVYDSMS